MGSIVLQILVLFLLILLNGFFSMTEIAVISAKRNTLRIQASEGNKKAEKALHMSEKPNLLLSTIQVGITLIGLLAGAFGGSTLAVSISQALPELGPMSFRYGLSLVLVIGLTTYFTIVIGELVPKRLGMSRPEAIAIAVSSVMDRLGRIMRPLVALLEVSTNFFSRLLRIKERQDLQVSEEEIRSVVEEGLKSGSIETVEKELLHQILDLGDLNAGDIMTPKSQFVWLDIEDDPAQIRSILLEENHAQYPVAKGGFETFLGMVQERDCLKSVIAGEKDVLKDNIYKAVFTSETTDALSILDLFRQTASKEIIVIDEYGEIEGLITKRDLLENIVGHLPEKDETRLIKHRADGRIDLAGVLPVVQLEKLLCLDGLPGQDRYDFRTVSGLLVANLGRFPRPGDSLKLADYLLTVKEVQEGTQVAWATITKENTHHEKQDQQE